MKCFFLPLFLVFICCYSPERDCGDYRTGAFKYEAYVDGEIQTSIFVRDEYFQIEQYQGKIDTSEIRWINSCEFVLTPVNPKSILDQYQIHMKILETTSNTYTFQYNVVGEDQKEKGIAVRLNN